MAEDQNKSVGKFQNPDLSFDVPLIDNGIYRTNQEPFASKEIKWTQKENIYKNAVVNIVFTTKWILDHCGKTLKHYEPSLTVEQFNLLQALRIYYPNPSAINSLKENMLDKNSDVSRLVEKLRRKGWVERHDNEKDRRVADVSLTKKGFELLSRLETEERRWPEILSAITEDEAEKLTSILSKLSNGGQQMVKSVIAIFLVAANLIFILSVANSICCELI